MSDDDSQCDYPNCGIPNAETRQVIRDARVGKNLIHYASTAEFFEAMDRGFADPTQTPIPYEQARKELGIREEPDDAHRPR